MDDIKSPSHTRARTVLPERRRTYSLSRAMHSATQQTHANAQQIDAKATSQKKRFKLPRRLSQSLKNRKVSQSNLSNTRLTRFIQRHNLMTRVVSVLLIVVLVGGIFFELFMNRAEAIQYNISDEASVLLTPRIDLYASKLELDAENQTYTYNKDFVPSGGESVSQSAQPGFTASFALDTTIGTTITDPINNVSMVIKPQYLLSEPIKDGNRLVYPIKFRNAHRIETLGASVVKEDIILNEHIGNPEFRYKLELPDGVEARMENDGSIGVYGVMGALLGNVSTGSEQDAELLKKARQNAEKNNLLFRIPAPFIKEVNRHKSEARVWYSLVDNELTVHSDKMETAAYPLTIDPSVYIETAAKLMRGNNESNIDFDITNQLIQKSPTTGARIDDWTSTSSMNSALWGQGMAVAGGYVYSVGGSTGLTSTTASWTSATTTTWQVPSGVTSLTFKGWAAGGGGGAGSGGTGFGSDGGAGGYMAGTVAVTPLETLDIQVGTGGQKGGGTSQGGYGGGATTVLRSGTALLKIGGGGGGGGGRGTGNGGTGGTGGGSTGQSGLAGSSGGGGGVAGGFGGTAGAAGTNGAAGAAGTSSGGGNAASPSTNCTTAGTGVGGNGGTGAGGSGGVIGNGSNCGSGGGGGGGAVGGGGGGSAGGTGGSANRSGGGGGGGSSSSSAGTTVSSDLAGSGYLPANDTDPDRGTAGEGGFGEVDTTNTAGSAGALFFTYLTGTSTAQTTVAWAKINSSSQAIESPNPGNGTCSGWCADSAYALPAARKNASVVAYNGFLYVIGGENTAGTPQTTVYIAKLGANGEPQLWHPTDSNKNNWVFWYTDTALASARSKFSAVAYNNRLYIIGGQTGASSLLTTNTVQVANMNPTGTLSSFSATGMQAITGGTGRYGHSAQVYNDNLYIIGGANTYNGAPITTVEYSKLNSDGTMNTWTTTNSLSGSGRMTMGGVFSTIWGAYIYVAGGCTAVSSGSCTAVSSEVQLASINADGSVAPFNAIIGLSNSRIGHSLIAWQNGLYRFGGCSSMSGTDCSGTLSTVDYGIINNDGDASTVSNSEPSGTSPCSGGSPYNCDLPPAGDSAGQAGQMSNALVINNGYIYSIGGCTDISTATECYNAASAMSGNVAYAALNSNGQMVAPSNCPETNSTYGLWCIDTTNRINGTAGVGASAATVFNNVIYVVGGTDGDNWQSNVWSVMVNPDGSLANAWRAQTFANLALGTARGYSYAFTRANPSNASTFPGNLYVLGGCNNGTTANGLGCGTYFTEVYKCNILPSGALEEANANDCVTNDGVGGDPDQLQIDADNVNASAQGLGLMAGTIYANRIYLVGGSCDEVGVTPGAPCGSTYAANRKDTIFAVIDASNNIVDATGSASGSWSFASAQMSPVRRRAVSFGYNGYIYSLAGYSGTASLQDLLFSKINVSTGDMGPWDSSGVVVTPRWDLRAIVGNGYVYAIGGCGTGAAPVGCTDMQEEVQTFQLYNNDSGAPVSYAASANQFTTDRFGASSAILNGYLYVAGGCTSTDDCSAATGSVQYTQIDNYGNLSNTWNAGNALPSGNVRAWGQLETVGGTLYYIGGQTSTSTDERAEVYYTTSFSSGNPTWSASVASNGLPAERTKFGASVWNGRIYVAGGLDVSAAVSNVVYVSPDLSAGGNISTAWSATSSFNVARFGASLVGYNNNLYLMGGSDGTNYLNDVQFASIGYKTGTITQSGNTITGSGTTFTAAMVGYELYYGDGYHATITGRSSNTSITVDESRTLGSATQYTIADGSVSTWTYTTSLPEPIIQGDAFAANGYMYLVGGRSATGDCVSNTLVAPLSANTTIASGNDGTGLGDWYETNVKYTGERYGNAVSYANGKVYVMGGACESFPTVSVVLTQNFTTATTAHNVTMPATVDAGDLLVVLFTNDGNATVTTPAGWTQPTGTSATQLSGTAVRGSVYTKSAVGTEDGTTVDFQTSATEEASSHVYRIPAGKWRGSSAATDVEIVSNNNGGGNTSAPDSSSLNPSAWGTENTLWITYAAGSSYDTVTTYPTSYENTYHNRSNTGTAGASTTSARRPLLAASENPSAFAMGNSTNGATFTIAVRPAAFALTGANRTVQTAFYSQPQVAKYSRMIDTDSDVFPSKFLMNGVDNATGASWRAKYRSSTAAAAAWGQETDFGAVTLGQTNTYTPKDSGGSNTNFARYYYFSVSIDSSQAFGYPEDVERGPTIYDLTLFFTSDPSKRLRHGKTFTGGELQPLDTPPP